MKAPSLFLFFACSFSAVASERLSEEQKTEVAGRMCEKFSIHYVQTISGRRAGISKETMIRTTKELVERLPESSVFVPVFFRSIEEVYSLEIPEDDDGILDLVDSYFDRCVASYKLGFSQGSDPR